MKLNRIFTAFFTAAVLLQMGTTYVIKEGGKEVGRWLDSDGKRDVVDVEQDKAASAKAGKPVGVKPVPDVWLNDGPGYRKAWEMAASGTKPVLLYFHATWCPYCRKLEREVFSDPAVRDYLKDVIKVKIDAEKEVQLAEKYHVTGYPRLLMLHVKTGKSERLHTTVTPQEFIRQAREMGLKGP